MFASAVPTGFIHDVVAEIATFKTQFDVFRVMKRVTEAYGARAFMVMNIPSPTSLDIASNSIITNWPADLLTAYDKVALLNQSVVVQRLRQSTAPLVFEIEELSKAAAGNIGESAQAMFRRFNLVRGAYFPVHEASGIRGAVSFSGDRSAFTFLEMMELSYLSIHVFNHLAEIRNRDSRVTETLTDREIDCLNWTAAGKTSVEIAEILGLSEHTINHYLNRATKKLDTVNRTQAVAKALRIGLIK